MRRFWPWYHKPGVLRGYAIPKPNDSKRLFHGKESNNRRRVRAMTGGTGPGPTLNLVTYAITNGLRRRFRA
jgi:hypothetical protein